MEFMIEIHDTSADENLGINRKAQYKDADVFLILAASNDQESLESVAKWKAEIREIEAYAPILLVLSKSDLLEETEEAVDVAQIKKK